MNSCVSVQVPASCTLPAAPPWPEETLHPLAPLPSVRQANGVETTQGSFYEARVISHHCQICNTGMLAHPLVALLRLAN